MGEFVDALRDPGFPLLRYTLAAGLLSSVAFGVMGTYVVARRISYMAGAISHCVLGGIGLGLYLREVVGLTWCDPMHCAVATALLAALIIGMVNIHARQREDSVIVSLWSVGMATGLIFLAKTPGYHDPMSYLFGSILLITRSDLWLIIVLDLLVVGTAAYFYNKLAAVCFDEEFARLRGIRTELYHLLLLCLTALTVVLLVPVVGIVLVIALLSLPAAVAGQCTRRLWHMMVLAILFCMVFTTTGIGLSYTFNLPGGPTIILLAAVAYLAAIAASRLRKTLGR